MYVNVHIMIIAAILVNNPIVSKKPATNSDVFPIYAMNAGDEEFLKMSPVMYSFILFLSNTSEPWYIKKAPIMIRINVNPPIANSGLVENNRFLYIILKV
jgi:hypothetical protein